MSVPAPVAKNLQATALFICRACGLIYDEAKGDPDSGLAAGTRFADIPDDWACPLCGVSKSDFEPYVLQAPARQAWRCAPSPTRAAASRRDAGTVIVGAGRAGWQMAQALRERNADMPITLVTACNGDVYDKPTLSVAMARGISPDTLAREAGADAALRLGVKLMAQTQAVHVAAASNQLRTSRGSLRYQHLVLAHGAQARLPAQFPAALCWRINHLQSYAKFRVRLGAQAQRIAVIGAGLIGSELANDLALGGHSVTLLEQSSRPLASCLLEAQSQQLLDAWRELPLRFVGGVQIDSVRAIPASSIKQITTHCGQLFEVEHIIVAAGLQTPHRLAASANLAWNNGIDVAPDTLLTARANIYALGDCIAINGQVSRYIEPIGRQAQTVAAHISGDAQAAYQQTRVPLRIKTSSRPFTL